MKNTEYFTQKILEVIRQAKSTPGWSISDYIEPISKLYSNLSGDDKKEFRQAVIKLLKSKDYLQDVITVIWMKLKFKEACPALLKLFNKPPMDLKEDGFDIGTEGVRISSIVALGELECKNATPFLNKFIEDRINIKKISEDKFGVNIYGVAMQALAKLSSNDASRYFGWWLVQAQEEDYHNKTLTKGVGEWQMIKDIKNFPDIDLPTSGSCASSVRICLFNVAKQHKLDGLKNWLKSVTLLREKDRKYLYHQILFSLEGKDEFFNLKHVLKCKGNIKSLAKILTSLPLSQKG